MSCAVISVNRSLIMLAAIWALVPVAAMQMGAKADMEGLSVLHQAPLEREPPPRELSDGQGLLLSLYLAITQPDMKRSPITEGR